MAGAAPPSSHRQRRAVLRQPCGSRPRRVPQAPPALPRPAGAERGLEIPAGPFPGEARSSGGFPRPAGKYRTSPLPPGPRPRSPRSAATGTSEGAARPREGAAGAEGHRQPTGTLLLPHEGAASGGAGAARPAAPPPRGTGAPQQAPPPPPGRTCARGAGAFPVRRLPSEFPGQAPYLSPAAPLPNTVYRRGCAPGPPAAGGPTGGREYGGAAGAGPRPAGALSGGAPARAASGLGARLRGRRAGMRSVRRWLHLSPASD